MGFACTRTARFWPPLILTSPTPGNCAIFCTRRVSARASTCVSGSVLEVRHPPPSGWLDEPGRLKGGGAPSPYSNSLKPTIIVTGILVTDIRFDLFQLKANRGDRIATRPKVLAREIAIMAPKLAGDGNRTFALEKPNDRCYGMLGRDLDAHMHMIWHHMSLNDAAFLLAGQLMKDWPELTTNLPKQLLPATFGHKHNMVLAIPARMRQALIER